MMSKEGLKEQIKELKEKLKYAKGCLFLEPLQTWFDDYMDKADTDFQVGLSERERELLSTFLRDFIKYVAESGEAIEILESEGG